MRNAGLLAILILGGSLFSNAQSSNSPTDKEALDKASGITAITGCVQMNMGHYMLIEGDGTSHELSGGSRQLKGKLGHQMEITGKAATRSVSSTQVGGASTVTDVAVFEVKSVKQVADKCE